MGLTELSGNGKNASSVVQTMNGGAIALKNGTFSFANGSEIKDNHAKGNGGGLYISSENATSIRCVGGSYINNTAQSGGGLYASGPIFLQFAANMQSNKAVSGGGMYLDNGINMTFGVNDNELQLSGLIVGNEAKGVGQKGVGGGVYLNKGTLQFALSEDFKDLGIYNEVVRGVSDGLLRYDPETLQTVAKDEEITRTLTINFTSDLNESLLNGKYVAVWAHRKVEDGESIMDNIVTCDYGSTSEYILND